MRRHPHLYEINARIFLDRLSRRHGRKITLSQVPEEEWKSIRKRGFDLVWLMGVWQRSPAAGEKGSPYAIHDYRLDAALGREGELEEVKARLHQLGLALMLDFVPNHLAVDHPWIERHPDRFVHTTKEKVREHPDWFFSRDRKQYFAHGRDPYFPPWKDTVQVNFFSEDLRVAWIDQLFKIADLADGMRCDMAMLGLNRIFEKVWGAFVKKNPRPEEEFWAQAISLVKQVRPDFLFLAESYWHLEWELQQLGFDYTYDKILYDRMLPSTPQDVRGHLTATPLYQNRSVRFIENHDEERAAAAFGREKSQAAAVVIATIPGLRFFHDGQLEGRRQKIPVQLAHEPRERPDKEILSFYEKLLSAADLAAFHDGEWRLLDSQSSWPGSESYANILAWCWKSSKKIEAVVAVNFSEKDAQARIPLPLSTGVRRDLHFSDKLSGETYLRKAAECRDPGLYVALGPWQAHVLVNES